MTASRLRLFAAAALAGALAACAHAPPQTPAAPLVPTPTERYVSEVAQVPDQIAIGVHPEGLSANQRDALHDFVNRWRDAGGAEVVVEIPADAADPARVRAMGYAVQAFLAASGVPTSYLRQGTYAAGSQPGPVLARFERAEAKAINCASGWDNLTSTMRNDAYSHFGCSIVANIAVQLADPRDLVNARPAEPSDAARRQKVLSLYREGKSSATEKEKQSDGTVSAAVQQQ